LKEMIGKLFARTKDHLMILSRKIGIKIIYY